MKFPIEDFFNKCGHICREMRIWSQLLKKSFTENFTFYAVNVAITYNAVNLFAV